MKLMKLISLPRFLLNIEIRKLKRKINKKGIKVLEIGAAGYSYRNFFPDAEWLSIDIKNAKEVDMLADARKLPFKNNSFDVVFCISVLEHVFEFEKVIKEMHRVVKKNGLVVIQTPFLFPFHDLPNDYYRFTPEFFKKILRDFKLEIKNIGLWKRLPFGILVIAKKVK